MKPEDPCILCAQLDTVSFERLTAWRKQYFPPERNFLEAHITLYHRLPFAGLPVIRKALAELAAQQAVFDLPFDSLVHSGGFVGIAVPSPEILHIKRHLDKEFTLWLAPQDRQSIKPHVTVTNNAGPELVQATLASLASEFKAWRGRAEGLQLFRYRKGPWEWLEDYSFAERL